jgi:hypothetical protein
VILVCDNLNTHKAVALYKTLKTREGSAVFSIALRFIILESMAQYGKIELAALTG